MIRASHGRWLRCSLMLLWCGSGPWLPALLGQEPAPQAESGAVASALAEVRAELDGQDLERALSRLDALMHQELSEEERGEALILRCEAHLALGKIEQAERDYREILILRPDHAPDDGRIPKKARARFSAARAQLVGRVRPVVNAKDAQLSVDGRVVQVAEDGAFSTLAGERLLRAELAGFDPVELQVTVPAGGETEAVLRLVPNARTIVVSTEPEGVELKIDGTTVGLTERSGPGQPATIAVENLPLGEHTLELSKLCHRTVRRHEILAVDLDDRSAREYAVVTLSPVEATLILQGSPAGAELHVDGQPAGAAGADPVRVCPGRRHVEVRQAGRALWFADVDLAEDEERTLSVEPRPNLVLVGVPTLPESLEHLEPLEPLMRGFNQFPPLEAPAAADLAAPPDWAAVGLSSQVDLALAMGAGPGVTLYSPLLRRAWSLGSAPEPPARPSFRGVSWGMFLADSECCGRAIVVQLTPGGAAEAGGIRPGDRLLTLGGSEIESAAQARRILDVASAKAPLEAVWTTPALTRREARLVGVEGPLMQVPAGDQSDTAFRAAWAAVDAVSQPGLAPSALTNLALIFSASGDHERALATLVRVRFPVREGVGDGTVQYLMGRELEWLGRVEEAVAAYRKAARSGASAFDDEGPAIAPAAGSRLADLGVSAEGVSSP